MPFNSSMPIETPEEDQTDNLNRSITSTHSNPDIIKDRSLARVNCDVHEWHSNTFHSFIVGNTDLNIHLFVDSMEKVLIVDFIPNDQDIPTEGTSLHNSKLFLYAFYEFFIWLKTNSQTLELIESKVNLISVTNSSFNTFLSSIFKRFGHSDLISARRIPNESIDLWHVDFNYKEFLKLPQEDALITFLNKVTDGVSKTMMVNGLIEYNK